MKLPTPLVPSFPGGTAAGTVSAGVVGSPSTVGTASLFAASLGDAVRDSAAAESVPADISSIVGLPGQEPEEPGDASGPMDSADAGEPGLKDHRVPAESFPAPGAGAALSLALAAVAAPALSLAGAAAPANQAVFESVTPGTAEPSTDSNAKPQPLASGPAPTPVAVGPAVLGLGLLGPAVLGPAARTSLDGPQPAIAVPAQLGQDGVPGAGTQTIPVQGRTAAPWPAAPQTIAALPTTTEPQAAAALQAAVYDPQLNSAAHGITGPSSANKTAATIGSVVSAGAMAESDKAAVPALHRQAADAAGDESQAPRPAVTTPAVTPPTLTPALTTAMAPAQLPVPTAVPAVQPSAPAGTPMLNEQLARPLFSLTSAPLGEHVMTIDVNPESLGPVTVRAHLATDGIRIELMSPSDAGREGLRTILMDLRRDLAAGGMPASLSVASGNGAQDTSGNPNGHGNNGGHGSAEDPENRWSSKLPAEEQGVASNRGFAPSDVARATKNSLDITV